MGRARASLRKERSCRGQAQAKPEPGTGEADARHSVLTRVRLGDIVASIDCPELGKRLRKNELATADTPATSLRYGETSQRDANETLERMHEGVQIDGR